MTGVIAVTQSGSETSPLLIHAIFLFLSIRTSVGKPPWRYRWPTLSEGSYASGSRPWNCAPKRLTSFCDSGELPSIPYGLPLTATIASLPAYFAARSLRTSVSRWQCGHHVANTSSSTGVDTCARSNWPAFVAAVNVGAVSPTLSLESIGASDAALGTALRE